MNARRMDSLSANEPSNKAHLFIDLIGKKGELFASEFLIFILFFFFFFHEVVV